MGVTINVRADERRQKKNGTYPLKLWVTKDRKTKNYSLVYEVSKEDAVKLKAKNPGERLRAMRDDIRKLEVEANEFVRNFSSFEFSTFEQEFLSKQHSVVQRDWKQKAGDLVKEQHTPEEQFDYSVYLKRYPILLEKSPFPGSLCEMYQTVIKLMLREGRIGNASSYQCSYRSMTKFSSNQSLKAITPSFLRQYYKWMLDVENNSRSTVGIYLRPLRAVFNEAIALGKIEKEYYPFGKRKFPIPSTRRSKKAMDDGNIEKLYHYAPIRQEEKDAKDYWFFCYFGNGMNPKDLVRLKYKNLKGEYIEFVRAKTEMTAIDPPEIQVYVNEDMRATIERLGNKDTDSNNYIFPVLQNGDSPLREYMRIQNFISVVNKWMKVICNRLEIKYAKTMEARHSFATKLKRSGASIEFIQEAMGHTDPRTTMNYLAGFQKDAKKRFSELLKQFSTSPEPIKK